MRVIKRLFLGIDQDISTTVLDSRMLGVARTLMALAQLSLVMLNDPRYFFVPIGEQDLQGSCSDRIIKLSIYCVSPADFEAANTVVAILLLVIASGILPRVSSILHFWVSYSIASSISLPDGGETTMQVVTLFMMIACLADGRMWHWQKPCENKGPNVIRAISWAGSWLVRVQVAYIYLFSGLAKLAVEQWQDGTATYYVSRMEYFGAGGLFAEQFRLLLSVPIFTLAATWGTIILEVILAILLLVNKPLCGKMAIAISAFIHVWIALMIGILSFALIMVASVLAAASYSICKSSGHKKAEPDEDGPEPRKVDIKQQIF